MFAATVDGAATAIYVPFRGRQFGVFGLEPPNPPCRWLSGEFCTSENQWRAIVIYGDAGVGKSTVASKLCWMERSDTAIMAYHLCKHSDDK